jgi:hypothetical protein
LIDDWIARGQKTQTGTSKSPSDGPALSKKQAPIGFMNLSHFHISYLSKVGINELIPMPEPQQDVALVTLYYS